MPTIPLLAIALRLSSGCVAPGEYPVVDTLRDPGVDLRSAKVYFRSDKYPKFYYTEMKPEGAGLRSVLPKPSAATESIVYYIETVDVSFSSIVSDEQVLEVRSDCLDEEDVEEVASSPPEITVGSMEAGGPGIPPGFEAVGIVGTIASTGILTGIGGGSGIGTAVVVGGLAAAGAGGAVAASGNEEPSTPGSDPAPGGGTAPRTTTTISAGTTTAPATSSTTSSTTSTVTSSTSSTTTSTTTSTTPTAPATTTTTTTPASVSACFSASFPGNSCNLKLDAACSTGPIASWNWVIDPGSALGGPSTHSGQTVNRTFPQCAGETVVVTLTVSGAGASDSTTQSIRLPMSQREFLRETVSCTFTSHLSSEELSGSVVLDRSRVESVRGGIPVSHVLRAHPGEHEVEAFLTATADGEALWTFDFTTCEALAPWGLESRQGQVVASGDRRIAFRVNGVSSEPVRFLFRLSR